MDCSGTGKNQVSAVKDKLNYTAHKWKVLDADNKKK
jgi:hypothetical protein